MTAIIILGIIIACIVTIAVIYNGLVTLKNRFKNAFAQIDVQLKRRYDLIPNLVEVVKKYMQHERETLEAVIAARNSAVTASNQAAGDPGDPGAMKNLASAEGMLTGALGKLFALSESYPDLKANQNMAQLQEELSSTENRIAFARQAFNDAVMAYNISREKFPNNLMAGMFNFNEAQLLESTEAPEERKAPKVTF
ncbi:MAG: LemA family protein [Desulfobacteraceae bacterium]|nr:LemA family protein [Desulfobacteraceae bacterium]MBC2756251.1 LemA family protein [Desulfobacteraceae bacterium]